MQNYGIGLKIWLKEVSGKPGDYNKKYMKIKFNSDDNLPLHKLLKLHYLTIIARSVFQEENKYYPQVSLDEYFYELWMLEYDRIDVTVKELMVMKHMHQKNVIFAIIDTF